MLSSINHSIHLYFPVDSFGKGTPPHTNNAIILYSESGTHFDFLLYNNIYKKGASLRITTFQCSQHMLLLLELSCIAQNKSADRKRKKTKIPQSKLANAFKCGPIKYRYCILPKSLDSNLTSNFYKSQNSKTVKGGSNREKRHSQR